MNTPSEDHLVLPRWLRSWEQFWFTPADPSVLALIRITCGIITLYTMFAYSYRLQDHMGEHAWVDLATRMDIVRDRPVASGTLSGEDYIAAPPPVNDAQAQYYTTYRQKWGSAPPGPYPVSDQQAIELDAYLETNKVDMRAYGLKPPTTEKEYKYLEEYTRKWKMPPPAYPKDEAEEKMVDDYIRRQGQDPRRLYARGLDVFSLWFHITDPTLMMVVHVGIVLTSLLFTIGCCTRVTAALLWFGSLCYIHRNPNMLFGADTMMNILLLYLMISPSGAVLSVDQWMRRWWTHAKPGVVRWWFGLLRRPLPSVQEIAAPAGADAPQPSVAANVAIRLLQVHLSIIYLVAGLSKLLGQAWWSGTAIWGTIACYEFAPMQYELYLNFLRFLGSNPLLLNILLTFGGLFTLVFEISYIFLIWRPSLRWIYLGSAILLHGFIGVFMGLKTFALIMLVMNMAFLRKDEVLWMFGWLSGSRGADKTPPRSRSPEPKLEPVVAATAGVKQPR